MGLTQTFRVVFDVVRCFSVRHAGLSVVMSGFQGGVGYTGQPGWTGPEGPVGAQGPRGFDGLPGQKGDRGFTGDPGFDGPEGQIGLPGPVGPPGSRGSVGWTGPQGNLTVSVMPSFINKEKPLISYSEIRGYSEVFLGLSFGILAMLSILGVTILGIARQCL